MSEIHEQINLKTLVDQYGLHIDKREYDEAANLFAHDGKLIFPLPAVATGPAEISAGFVAALGRVCDNHGLNYDDLITHHQVGNHICSVTGDQETGTTYTIARHCDPNASVLLAILRYEDEYVKTGEGWRFKSRKILRLWTERAEVA